MRRRWGRIAGVSLALVIGAGCTVPPPPGGGGTTTTTTTGPPGSTTTSAPSTTTTSAPATTTTSEVPDPGGDESWSVSLAGPFRDATFDPGNSIVTLDERNNGDHRELWVGVQDLVGDNSVTFTFATREGANEELDVGYYGDAQRWPFNEAGRPGISLSPWDFCSSQFGDFEIRDLRRDGPEITAIWITYQRYCGDAWARTGTPTFGEIRIGYPVAAQEVAPRVVRWPGDTMRGFAAHDVPVTVRPTGDEPVEVTDVAVSGTHAGDFPIRENGCRGVVGHDGCNVVVGFAPTAPGPRHASLRVTTSAGPTEVSLDAAGELGRSEWVLDIDYEDPSRPDQHLVLPNSATIGGPYQLDSAAVDPEGLVWRASFNLSPPEPFAEGREYAWAPWDQPGLRMSLSHGNAACEIDRATAGMTDLAFTGPDDRIALLDLDMDVHCRASYGHTVQGRIRYRDRDDRTPPTAVTGATAARDGDRVELSWTNPGAADLAGVIVRSYPGDVAPATPSTGTLVYWGAGDTTAYAAPDGRPIALSIWAYDHEGNVGEPTVVRVEP